MKSCDQQYLVIDYFFDEITGTEKALFEQHLRLCAECRENLQALAATAPLIKKQKRDLPDNALLKQYHQNLKVAYYAPETLSLRISKFVQKFIIKPSLPIRIAEAAALLLIGIVIGRMMFWHSPSPAELNNLNINYATIQSSVSEILLDNYLQETELLLLDVANLNPTEDEKLLMNLKQLAKFRNLLQKTLICRSQAEELNDEELVNLINEIELVLLELCNMKEETLIETCSGIKRQLEESHLLFEIQARNFDKI